MVNCSLLCFEGSRSPTHLPHKGPLPKKDASSCLRKSNHNQPVGSRAVNKWGQEKGRGWLGCLHVQAPIPQGPEAREYCQFTISRNARAPDTVESLGAVNISVSKGDQWAGDRSPLYSLY